MGDGAEVVEGGGEVVDDFGGDEVGAGEVVEVLEAVVFEPEDVEVEFVARAEIFVAEAAEAFGFSAGALAGDEVVEVAVH